MNINLHIEQLIVDGSVIDPDQGHTLQRSVIAELTQVLVAGGLTPELISVPNIPRIAEQTMTVGSGDNAPKFGKAIARSIYGGIGHE